MGMGDSMIIIRGGMDMKSWEIPLLQKRDVEKARVLTETEVANWLGLSKWTIRNWRLKAGLPYFGTAGRIFYREDAVLEWMQNEEARNAAQSRKTNEEAIMCHQKSGNAKTARTRSRSRSGTMNTASSL